MEPFETVMAIINTLAVVAASFFSAMDRLKEDRKIIDVKGKVLCHHDQSLIVRYENG